MSAVVKEQALLERGVKVGARIVRSLSRVQAAMELPESDRRRSIMFRQATLDCKRYDEELRVLRKAYDEARVAMDFEVETGTNALAAAVSIVRDAEFASIDWRREPLTDRERDLREAIIRRVEVEKRPKGPAAVTEALQCLLELVLEDDDDDEADVTIGSDLSAAIERARDAWNASYMCERQAENLRLFAAARRDLDGEGSVAT